ncbi:Myb/SANT-like DNA-binding domain protein [Rhynchospora pubera]|uniref:Myb/SANT-like DNA-binding domain protein n=2 Tax=Rhynchospora pubera TaxID=906938 RepID=A0AAV8D2C9_9POAL|nr:Myb/SANT-like DNA-binding domain protein [Rhynchospora pubera]KAJ4761373.1 Myb/SANT-like DNA-binding domain protein [Rhynchospora pubera]KAJ4761380.1 Myb/SANT-like DNA-binding domain protein [Rhynchospora pubera]
MAKKRSASNTAQGASLVWTEDMDQILINAFIHEQSIGNRPNGTFSTQAYDNIVKELQEAFPEKLVDKDKIKNRIKYLKKGFGACYDIFKNATSGFAWSPHTKMWDAEPGAWATFIQAYPQAKDWMGKPVPHYESLKQLFAKDRANGDGAETPAEMRQRLAQRMGIPEGNIIDDIDRMATHNEATRETDNENISSSPEANKKHKTYKEEVQEKLLKGIESVSDAITKSTDALVKAHTAKLSMPAKEIYQHVNELGLDPMDKKLAYRFLTENANVLEMVLGYPIEERKEFLMDILPRY